MKNKQAVSLIVLVITIITLTILTGAIIITLNNVGVVEQSEEAVQQFNVKAIEELIATAWSDKYLSGERNLAKLKKAVQDALDKNKITEQHYSGYILKVTTSGAGLVKKESLYNDLNHGGKIPIGGTYYVSAIEEGEDGPFGNFSDATTVYGIGDEFPKTMNVGDVYVYGDYQYMYGMFYEEHEGKFISNNTDGWAVVVNAQAAKKASLGLVLESINDAPIKCLSHIFCGSEATAFTEPFKVPDSVTNISWMFCCGSSLNGTIVINANNIQEYNDAMFNASDGIILTGKSDLLEEIAKTKSGGNVTIDRSLVEQN